MPVTLAQAALNATDDIDVHVIDEFRKSSALLDLMQFHNAVSPAGGGATLTYGYTRLITQRAAAFRAINTEYTPEEVTKARYTVDLKQLGGSYQIDRVLDLIARGAETALQMQQLIKATQAKFGDAVINGDTDVEVDGFDGLNKALRGSTTEIGADTVTDWSAIDTSGFSAALDTFDDFLGYLDGQPTALLANARLAAKLRAIARRANQYVESPVAGLTVHGGGGTGNPFTRQQFGTVAIIDVGDKAGSSSPIIPLETRDPDNTGYTVTVTGSPTGGDYTITVTTPAGVATTAVIAHNATAAVVQSTIRALANVGAQGVTVSGSAGGPYTVTFQGELTDQLVTLALGTNGLTGGSSPSVTFVEVAVTTNYTNLTDLYAVRIGMDGFHGVSAAGSPLVRQWLPDFTKAGAVKTGEVELGPVAVALKSTKAAAVLRNIKVS